VLYVSAVTYRRLRDAAALAELWPSGIAHRSRSAYENALEEGWQSRRLALRGGKHELADARFGAGWRVRSVGLRRSEPDGSGRPRWPHVRRDHRRPLPLGTPSGV